MSLLSSAVQVTDSNRYRQAQANPRRYRAGGKNPVFVLHTIEGRNSYSLARGHRYPPHLWYTPRTRELYQTLPLDQPGLALKHPSGTWPETNHRGPTFQVEIDGRARDVRNWPDEYYKNLAEDVIIPVNNYSIETYGKGFIEGPTSTQVRFADEQSGLGILASTRSPIRLTGREWLNAHGIVGHQHVPLNDHWDPGFFNMDKLLSYAQGPVETRVLSYDQDRGFTMQGSDVVQWQELLLALGYDLGVWGADGFFGGATDTATRSLESDLTSQEDTTGEVTPELIEAARDLFVERRANENSEDHWSRLDKYFESN